MHTGFLNGFSDYKVQFKLNREEFIKKFVIKLNIDFELSVGIFHQTELVAFIFHSVNKYENRTVLYNGGTGVAPAHRGKRLAKEMYEFVLPLARKRGLKHSVLEVLTNNEKAIRAYESVGFRKGAILKCFKTLLPQFSTINRQVMIVPQRVFNPGKFNYMGQSYPSYQDTNQQ
ncbi:MAG: GNAT family N-acetyltransferase, partial [Cyclobacteriaceae bacterium]